MVRTDPNIGILHDWLDSYGGAEKQIEQLAIMYPGADLYTVFDLRGDFRPIDLSSLNIHTSWLNDLPKVKSYYRSLLLLAARAIEQFDVTHHDIVMSVSSALSKGAITRAGQTHIAYVNSPARYAWDLHAEHIDAIGGMMGPLKRAIAREMFHRFRNWDMRTPQSIDLFLGNSNYVSERIWKTYRRRAYTLYPPVDTEAFVPSGVRKDDYFVCASRLVPYKRMDLIAEAFSRMPDKKLVIIGSGPELERVKAKAGQNVEVLGYQPFDVMREHFQRAKALVFAAQEDFGIVPVEAQACGTPVIALDRGGTAETIRPLGQCDRPTGVAFTNQTAADIQQAVEKFDAHIDAFDPSECRKNALRFSNERFRAEVGALVEAGLRDGFREEAVLSGGYKHGPIHEIGLNFPLQDR